MLYLLIFLTLWLLINNSPYIFILGDCKRPDKKFNKEVFPDPDGPIIAVNEPALTIPLILFRIILSTFTFLDFPFCWIYGSIIDALITKFFHEISIVSVTRIED